jgi:hypothetical protein
LLEAEPQRAAWARGALCLNHIYGRVVEAAIARRLGMVSFAVRSFADLHAANWYGQAINDGPLTATNESYFGHPIWRDHWYEKIYVPSAGLEDVAPAGVIDLVNADIQGAELDMVCGSIDFLDARVRRVHIGTHSTEIERAIRDALAGAGWRPVWDFSLQGERERDSVRPCWFSDGGQGWINLRLVDQQCVTMPPFVAKLDVGAPEHVTPAVPPS